MEVKYSAKTFACAGSEMTYSCGETKDLCFSCKRLAVPSKLPVIRNTWYYEKEKESTKKIAHRAQQWKVSTGLSAGEIGHERSKNGAALFN